MKRTLLAAMAVIVAASAVYAEYGLSFNGDWPKSWPTEMEPLRKQARTYEGPIDPSRHYAIRFNSRKELEAVWTSLLKVKTKGAPITVTRGPSFFLGDSKGGVIIHCPPEGNDKEARNAENLEVVVDDETVVFEHLKVPKGTPVVDQRKKAGSKE